MRRQLVADVPRCLLLSGGLDSGTLTALAAAHLTGERVPTFAVDFTGQTENFTPDDLRDARRPVHPRSPSTSARATTDIVLDPKALADPAVRRAALVARDTPLGVGDMDFSLYLLFKAIRAKSTVALFGRGG